MAKIIVIIFLVIGLFACSSSKGSKKDSYRNIDNSLISSGQEEVRKRFGEPDSVSRTADNHIMWIYKPTWKLMPNEKDTLFVEFEEGKVIKLFRLK
jgi:hypothetical protein